MQTFMAKNETLQRQWYVIDSDGLVLGRLASQVASILRGKNKPTYTPHVDAGDHVIVINCDKIKLTGAKLDKKKYYYHTGYAGGIKEISYRRLMATKPEFALKEAVRGMLPSGALGNHMLTKLRVYRGPEHEHQAQKPQELKLGK